MILSILLASSLIPAQEPLHAALGPPWLDASAPRRCAPPLRCEPEPNTRHARFEGPWAAERRSKGRGSWGWLRWERGRPVLAPLWGVALHGPISAPIRMRPRTLGEPEGSHAALAATHTGRVALVEWNRQHARIAGSWNVSGMVFGAPRWLDSERFVVGTDADTLHAFARGSGRALWARVIGRCRRHRVRGPLGARCDVGAGLAWQPRREQLLAVSDGVYALDARGQLRWQWPATAGLPRGLGSPVVADARGRVYLANPSGQALSLDARGQLRWSVDLGAPISGRPRLWGDRLVCYFARNGRLSCIDRERGEIAWMYQAPGPAMGEILVQDGSAPALRNGGEGAGVAWRLLASGVSAALGPLGSGIDAARPAQGRGVPPTTTQGGPALWLSSADGTVTCLDPLGGVRWSRRLRHLGPQGLLPRSEDEMLAVLREPQTVLLGLSTSTGRVTWVAQLDAAGPGQLHVVGSRWLMAVQQDGEMQGYWLPPSPRERQTMREASTLARAQRARRRTSRRRARSRARRRARTLVR